MARIPVSQREELASSVVGTPGVDTSSADIFNSVAAAGGQVANTAFAIQKQRQEALDAVDANSYLTDFQLQGMDALKEHQQAYATEPSGKTEAFRASLQQRLDTTLTGITNPRIKAAVTTASQTTMRSLLVEQSNWAYKQEAVVAGTKVIANSEKLAATARLVAGDNTLSLQDKVNKVSTLFAESGHNIKTAGFVFAPDQHAIFTADSQQGIATGFLNELVDQSPTEAITLLDGGYFDNVLDDKTRKQILRDANEKILNVEKTAELAVKVGAINQNVDLWELAQKGQLTMNRVSQLPDGPNKKVWRDMVLKTNPLTEQEQFDKYAELWVEYDKITDKKGNATVVKAKASYEDILVFQDQMMDLRTQGVITEDQANSFMKTLAIPKDKKGQALVKKTQQDLKRSYRAIGNWMQRNGTQDEKLRGKILAKFIREYDGKEVPADTAVQHAIKQQMTEDNPALALLPETPNSIMKPDGREIKVLPGQSRLKADVKPSSDKYIVQRNVKTGEERRLYPDGTFEIIKKPAGL